MEMIKCTHTAACPSQSEKLEKCIHQVQSKDPKADENKIMNSCSKNFENLDNCFSDVAQKIMTFVDKKQKESKK